MLLPCTLSVRSYIVYPYGPFVKICTTVKQLSIEEKTICRNFRRYIGNEKKQRRWNVSNSHVEILDDLLLILDVTLKRSVIRRRVKSPDSLLQGSRTKGDRRLSRTIKEISIYFLVRTPGLNDQRPLSRSGVDV